MTLIDGNFFLANIQLIKSLFVDVVIIVVAVVIVVVAVITAVIQDHVIGGYFFLVNNQN